MKKILFLLAFLINALLVFSQAPIPLNRLSRSSDRFMMMMSDTNRYASYQHFNYWLSKFADSLNLQNPYWLGSILPQQSVSIGAERHNFIISNGIIGSFATDTTANGWILQSYVSGLNADGVGKIGGRNYLTAKRYGIDFDGATPTIVSGNVGLSLSNEQVQDSTLDNAYRYVWTVPAGNALTGVGEYVRNDSIGLNGIFDEANEGGIVGVENIILDKPLLIAGTNYGFNVQETEFSQYVEIEDTAFIGIESSYSNTPSLIAGGLNITSEVFDLKAQVQTDAINEAGTVDDIELVTLITNRNLLQVGYDENGEMEGAGFIFGKIDTVRHVMFKVDNDGEVSETAYPDIRNDTGTAVNMLSTDGDGTQQSHPLTETFGAIWLQSSAGITNTGTQSQAITGFSVDLNDDSNNYVVFGDTVVQISLTGCYTISMIAAVSSAAALNTDGWDVQMSYGGSVVPPNYVSNSPFIDLQPQYVNRSWTIKTTSSNVSVRPVFSTTIANGATTADISGVMWSIKRNY